MAHFEPHQMFDKHIRYQLALKLVTLIDPLSLHFTATVYCIILRCMYVDVDIQAPSIVLLPGLQVKWCGGYALQAVVVMHCTVLYCTVLL